jgi:hypothetical protein
MRYRHLGAGMLILVVLMRQPLMAGQVLPP